MTTSSGQKFGKVNQFTLFWRNCARPSHQMPFSVIDMDPLMTINGRSVVATDHILGCIYTIRKQRVILSNDLAQLYAVETRSLVQAVKRNLDRFPGDFMFQLTQSEFNILKSQIGISSGLTTRTSIRFYRTRGCNAIERPKKQASSRGEHRYHARPTSGFVNGMPGVSPSLSPPSPPMQHSE